jgi:cobalt-zinc-cadmium efflux system outer membrane protein
MSWREALAAALLVASPALAQQPQPAQFSDLVTLEQVLELVNASPRIAAAARDVDAARADRIAAGAYPNPSLTFGTMRPSDGERTMFNGDRQSQAMLELPLPVFGQMGARGRAAELQAGLADTQLRLAAGETRRQAALGFARLLGAQEQLAARRSGLAEVERIRGLVAGRLASGMASRYDLARADAEVSLAALALQRAETAVSEQSAAIAALVDSRAWRPRAAGSLEALVSAPAPTPAGEGEDAVERGPALRAARDEAAAAESRVELAQRELLPVPSVQLGRTWTSGPFGAANYVGIVSEIPISSDRRSLADKAKAQAQAARERERATGAALRADYRRQLEALHLRREALVRFDREVFSQQGAFLEMAESAYRLGRGSLFELLDARRTLIEASTARLELMGGIAEAQLELRALAGAL